jgi:hypothetical protein
MRIRVRTMLVTAIMLVTATLPAHAVVQPTPVKTTKAFEWAPAAGHNGVDSYFAWTQDILGKPNAPDSAFFQINEGRTRRINPGHTYGFIGDFDGGTSTLIYQQVAGDRSDLHLFDVSDGIFGSMPAGINTSAWQWNPSIDTDEGTGERWILYGENLFNGPKAPWRLYLYNGANHPRKLLLDQTTNRCGCLFAGDVAYPWVVWSKGLLQNVFRYNIVTHVKNKVVLSRDRDEYYASVTSDGTVYVAQAGDRCGVGVRIYRVDPDGSQTLLFALPPGSEPLGLNATDTGAGVTLYSDRYFCATKTSNIFRIDNADTATRQLGVTWIGDGIRRRASTSGAWLRSRRSSLRCEASGRCRPGLRADASA